MSTFNINTRPKRSLGQNYLVDDNISRNIIDSFNIEQDDIVIEIGAGQGAITKHIIGRTKNFIAIEIDRSNAEILKQKFPQLTLLNQDVLKVNFKSIYKSQFSGLNSQIRVIGNIPYNITTEIMFKLIDEYESINDAQLMIQDEVAIRFASEPDSKEYGIPSVIVQAYCEPKLLFKVPNTCFYPKPKVDSRIIYFDFQKNRLNQIKDKDFFRKFVRTAFSTRRKTLRNCLKKLELDLDKADFDFNRRAETLSVDELIELANELMP